MKKIKLSYKIQSLILCVALLISYIPLAVIAADSQSISAQSLISSIVVDPGTADSWESMMGTDADGNRYAGRVWVDKSVYKNGDVAILNKKGNSDSSFTVSLKDDEALQVIFSALGSSMTTTETKTSTGPMDVVLVLDTSTSMDDEDSQGVTRLERTITSANSLLEDLLSLKGVRVSIVTYNVDSETVIPLAEYNNGVKLVVTDYYNNGSSDAGVVSAYDNDNKLLGNDDGYTNGTNLQSGIDRGFNVLANATNTSGRVPVAIVLTDGQANRASREGFYELSSHRDTDGTSAYNRNLYLSTLLNAAYNKTKVENHYGKDAMVYTVGVDVTTNHVARLLMNPADATNGFKDYGYDMSKNEITQAYRNFLTWSQGRSVSYNNWTFDHGYPTQNGAITAEKIAANIYYSDNYYDVSSAALDTTFNQIYEELASSVFNPISSSTTTSGATGVDNTPLIYVDYIGQYMEIKEIQAVTLFGQSFTVIRNGDGTYTVTEATGLNPTTNESWNTKEDILISVVEEDGAQKLEIRINQEILPIILEQVVSETIGNVTTSTITELVQSPLRVFYTVGIDNDILLPNGKVDVSKIQGYEDIDDAAGTVSFYSGRFGVKNAANGEGVVIKGDSHVGFKPSAENRYYYHQKNQGIFTKITDSETQKEVTIGPNNEYGIVWNDNYELTWMTYEEYLTTADDAKVYTYVTYYHPTPDANDAPGAAEEVTYLVYTEWKYLKESVAFYDAKTEQYLNEGKAIPEGDVATTIANYLQENPDAQLYAVLGIGSLRTSRLHNMTVEKEENLTGTATERYSPEYTHERSSDHYDNDVIVWLGNNGKVTVDIETGIALTKAVTEEIGDPDDTYELTVTVEAGVSADPSVVDSYGNDVSFTYTSNVLTVYLKAGETVYISGIPGGTKCEIGEIVDGDYYIDSKTDFVTVPKLSEVLNGAAQFVAATVTNAPNKYGNLFVTKEITSDHAVPDSIFDEEFTVVVNVGTSLAGKAFDVVIGNSNKKETVDAQGNITLAIKARQTAEILRLPAGTAVTVTETITDSHFTVSYRTRNHSGLEPDSDQNLVIPADANATAIILNRYTPTPVSVDLDINITKNFADASVADRLAGGTFNFTVQKYNASNQAWESFDGDSIKYNANEYGEKTLKIADVLGGEIFSEVGTYSYRIYEEKGSVANVTYDRIVYAINVVVTDNGGQLVAEVVGNNNVMINDENADGVLDYAVEFVNTYETAPISMDISKQIVNNSGDSTVSAAGFKFRSIVVDANGNPLYPNAPENATNLIISDAAGEAHISGVYTKEQIGTHYYIVYEVDDDRAGWTYSGAQYFITVVVAEDNAGKLFATMSIVAYNDAAKAEKAPTVTDGNKGQLYFTNTYDPDDISINIDGHVRKELTGKTLEADQFTFFVYKDADRTAYITKGTNNLDGDVHFVDFEKLLTFDKVGKYEFDILEYIPSAATLDAVSGKYYLNGMYYDATIYDLVVEVTNDSQSGKLVASWYFEDSVSEVVTFYNEYKPTPTQFTISGTKILHGRALRNDEFAFELYDGNTLVETVKNKADGSFTFKTIPYTSAGTYTYTVKEVKGNLPGISYDETNITVTVVVTDTNGVLSATSTTSVEFENTYTAKPAELTFNGTKTLKGANLADKDFKLELYQTDSSFSITNNNANKLDYDENVSGKFGFERSLDKAGTYYFVIVEDASDPIKDIVYDSTQHRFTVSVTDSGDGQLKATVTNMITGVSSQASASVSADVGFTNATFDEVTEKTVKIERATTVIDGNIVQPGDILTYSITYTNYTGKNVVADIMDTIPQYTEFVEFATDAASAKGTYAGTHVNWLLNVARGESVTVSFKVRVLTTGDVTVKNQAYVNDGNNTYSTNEVTNGVGNTTETVSGVKTWNDADDQDGKRPTSNTINLFADGVEIAEVNVTAQNGWKYTFDNLPKYSNGNLVTYTITEDEVEDYTTTYDGYNVTNNYTPGKTSVSVTKTWNDANDQDGIRPDSITVNLYANGVKVAQANVTAQNGWKHTFENLDKYASGTLITYTVTEEAVDGYTAEINGFEIINTHTPEKTEISVNKIWNDANNQDGKRPASITINLLANGKEVAEARVTAQDGWKYTFEDLDKYSNGAPITYTITENDVPGYTISIDGFTVTNTYNPEKTNVSGTKTWNDANNQDGKRPASITINLLANGVEVDEVKVSAENGWKFSFENLPKYENGNLITYTITEDAVDGYTTSISGFNVTNTYNPEKTNVSGTKTWDDNDNQYGKRPESIVINLLADGTVIKTVTVTAESGWTFSFTDLPKYKDGALITYTVTEDAVDGYVTVINGFNVTNTYVMIPQTGDNTNLRHLIALLLASGCGVIGITAYGKKRKSADE